MNKAAGFMVGVALLGYTQAKYFGSDVVDARSETEIAGLDTSKDPTFKRKLSGSAKAFRDRRGHFSFRAKLNGKSVKVLVDTGATDVAIPAKTAKRIGIKVKPRDFRYRASTANGIVMFARARIKEIRIDGVRVRNVRAAVLPDGAMSGVLLGMSFLKKLKSFEINGRTLTLKK